MLPEGCQTIQEKLDRGGMTSITMRDVNFLLHEIRKLSVYRDEYFKLVENKLEEIKKVVEFQDGCG